MAKIIEAPIFHVNGNDPLAVIAAVEAAFDYRQTFGCDVVIDMYCWRKHGHNESDEPAFTQPLLYKTISEMPLIGRALGQRLVASGEFTEAEIKDIETNYQKKLEVAFDLAKASENTSPIPSPNQTLRSNRPIILKALTHAFLGERLKMIAEQLAHVPEDFHANKKIIRQLNTKLKAFEDNTGIDWGMGEALAFGSLLLDGTPVRLSGQDCERGTFSHRHSTL